MWSIKDEDALLVAKEVYARLLKGSAPDSGYAAKAPHAVTECLRDKMGEKEFAR
jgi:hypothetical protein